MDTFLVEYLKSGKAWVLVGSGPSIEMGYPKWEQLATLARNLVALEHPSKDISRMNKGLEAKDFPMVFEIGLSILGEQRLLAHLQSKMVPSQPSRVYELLSQWPVSVYLTTNYDDEIQKHLARIGEAYIPYSNSPAHLSLLTPGLTNAVIKLHGDLRSEEGLILSSSQYHNIEQSNDWQYWRTTMTAVFRMVPIIIVGHSLSDKNIKHVLKIAKDSVGVNQPICWIAPDISSDKAREYLENYRIRVIPYDNRDGTHLNLVRQIENISQFIFPRTSIKIQKEIADITVSPLGSNASAPGFFVFNKIAQRPDFEDYRVDVICAAIQSIIPKLTTLKEFTLDEALHLVGWPKNFPIDPAFSKRIIDRLVERGLVSRKQHKLLIEQGAQDSYLQENVHYEHVKKSFIQSLILRIRREYAQLSEEDAQEIANYIEASLVGFFRECGLSLATTLIGRNRGTSTPVPSSIIKFINQASAKYNDILKRQAFSTVSVDIFTKSEDIEKNYLGRISQGFFAFHALGLFGDLAKERLDHAKETIWIIDSSVQIPLLAFAAPTNGIFRESFSRLREMGIRLFTTDKLFEETIDHLDFANDIVKKAGPGSHLVLAAATGQAPYRKTNQFLGGFVRWQASGKPSDWEAYLFQIFGVSKPKRDDVKKTLRSMGVEVYPLEVWPGYIPPHRDDYHQYEQKIVDVWEEKIRPDLDDDADLLADFHKKASPEAEALVVIVKERNGEYHMISSTSSPAWFISQTSMLNAVNGNQVTWQPEAFLRFTATLALDSAPQNADRAFEMLLLAFTQLDVNLLDEKTLNNAFGGIIDQADISLQQMRKAYEELLAEKYSESSESVVSRLSPIQKPWAAIQLSNEIIERQSHKLHQFEAIAKSESQKVSLVEGKLKKLEGFQFKMEEKKRKQKKKARKLSSRPKKKKRGR